jgi:hypothetical protein
VSGALRIVILGDSAFSKGQNGVQLLRSDDPALVSRQCNPTWISWLSYLEFRAGGLATPICFSEMDTLKSGLKSLIPLAYYKRMCGFSIIEVTEGRHFTIKSPLNLCFRLLLRSSNLSKLAAAV